MSSDGGRRTRSGSVPRLSGLSVGTGLGSRLADAAAASHWRHRQAALGAGIEFLAERQAELGLPCPTPIIEPFFDRDYMTVNMTVSVALVEQAEDATLKNLPLMGSIEQWSDNVDLLSNPERRAKATSMYVADSGSL